MQQHESETLRAQDGNVLIGCLGDGTPCALVSDDDLELAHDRMSQSLGRETYPGELLGAIARELQVNRVIEVYCPRGTRLDSLLQWTGPGTVVAQPESTARTLADLREVTVTRA